MFIFAHIIDHWLNNKLKCNEYINIAIINVASSEY